MGYFVTYWQEPRIYPGRGSNPQHDSALLSFCLLLLMFLNDAVEQGYFGRASRERGKGRVQVQPFPATEM